MSLTREQDKLRMRARRAAMTEEQKEEERRKARERMDRLARSRGRQTWEERYPTDRPKPARKRRSVSRARPRAVKPSYEGRAPSELRGVWSKAQPNSSIRRLFPSMRDLDRGYAEGAIRLG